MVRDNRYSAYRIDLCGSWRFAWTENPPRNACSAAQAESAGLAFIACDVPGNFELDLFKSGHLPDPFFGMNPVEVRKATEACHVYYARTFEAVRRPGAIQVLVFEGLDCFAEVYVNSRLAASFDNMLIEHEVQVDDFLTDGMNEVFIHIRPAAAEAAQYSYAQLYGSHAFGQESLYVRKAPHMYGWDIMPRFLSAGIFRPAAIECRPRETLAELYLKTSAIDEDRRSAKLTLFYQLSQGMDVSRHPPGDGSGYRISLKMKHERSTAEASARVLFKTGQIVFDVQDPAIWWPKGRGEASLYDVEVTLEKCGAILETCRFKHGIRTVKLERTPLTSVKGEGEFVFIVNGEKVFIKGTNWVPADAFHSRDKDRIPVILDMAADLNCNMIRCWGGNIYEDESFFDACDRAGILVWQDFAMACSIYPQESWFAAKIAEEAAAVIRRLRGHACLALWCGDNECDWSYLWHDSKADPNTNILTRKILPEAVRLHDGTRPYIGSSPLFDEGTLEKGADFLTEMHLWGPRDYYKRSFYTRSLCHFASEIGYHGCPSPASIRRFISEGKVWPCLDNDEWILHATSPVPGVHVYDYRVALMCKQIKAVFGDVPGSLDDFSYASQAVQAEAVKFFIEMFRIAKWRRTGIIWWNLCDGWPQFSDAVVDYYFDRKLAYDYIKICQQDVLVMLGEPENARLPVFVSNDTRFDRSLHCRIADADTGEILFDSPVTAFADRSAEIGQIPFPEGRQQFFLISWEGDVCGRSHYLAGQPPFELARYRRWAALKAFCDCRRDKEEPCR